MDEQDKRLRKKPSPELRQVFSFVKTHWDLNVNEWSLKQIESYDDANFYCDAFDSVGVQSSCLVKFYNATETTCNDILHGMFLMLQTINERLQFNVKVPTIISPYTQSENFVFMPNCKVRDGTQSVVAVRVFKWIQGTTLSRKNANIDVLTQLGRAIVEVTIALDGFDHKAFHRRHLWDLACFDMSIQLVEFLDDIDLKQSISQIYKAYLSLILPIAHLLPKSIIMGDCNEANVIVTEQEPCCVVGLIDFSDAVYSWTVNEVAIAMAYALLTTFAVSGNVPYSRQLALGSLLAGYVAVRPLNELELQVLPLLIVTRLSISLMIGAHSISKDPDNEYLKLHAIPARNAVKFMWSIRPETHTRFFTAIQNVFYVNNGDRLADDSKLMNEALYVNIINSIYK